MYKRQVLGIAHPHSREKESAAIAAATEILETRGSSPRIYRNTLVFFAADKTRLQELGDAVRYYLAWESKMCIRDSLYTICERKKWAREALAYNTLVQSWPEIERLAGENKGLKETAQRLFGEE